MKIVTVSFKAKPEKRKEVIELCLSMIEPSRAEEGCISYNFYQDVTDSNKFFFFEEWKNQQAIDRHADSIHYVKFLPIFQSLIVGKSNLQIRSLG
ncbi:MAG: antibiotic biosynthesis monooxygenase [Ignavibacteriales bacterium]|nr:antibiotic biosynthesis monooxygenase [Ignavibacteriales bacterium]